MSRSQPVINILDLLGFISLSNPKTFDNSLFGLISILGDTSQTRTRFSDTARKGGSIEWREMVKRQREKTSEFQKSYCYRVVIEGIISALKHIFGPLIRSRKRHNQDVEVLTRLILWNYMHIEPEEF